MTKNPSPPPPLPFAVVRRALAAHAAYHYEDDLVHVSDEPEAPGDAIDTPHRWTGAIARDRDVPAHQENAARVWCGGDVATCSDCGTSPPCGGTVEDVGKPRKLIAIHRDAGMTSPDEISFGKPSLHRIAILEPGASVRDRLIAWRAAHADHSAAVYHIYEIATAPSRPALVGKLIAIPVIREPDPVPAPR